MFFGSSVGSETGAARSAPCVRSLWSCWGPASPPVERWASPAKPGRGTVNNHENDPARAGLRIDQQQQAAPPQPVSEVLPGFVRGIINGALANGTPIVVAYTDENGGPVLSLRGSTQVYSDTQLCIWVRNAGGGIVKAMARNNRVSLLYRDSKVRTTLIMQGRGHVETDPSVRERVFQLSPEVEQNHDPSRKGAALIIDIISLQGTTVRGMVKVTPPQA